MNKTVESFAFSEVDTYEALKISLLKKANNQRDTRNGNTQYLCHYTSIDAAISIIRGQKWYLGSPLKMNDGLEISHADINAWRKIFLASFMIEPKESIAMWSMYAQPWSNGVMLRIPIEKFKQWVKSAPTVSSANSTTKRANPDNITNAVNLSFHAVAYTNAESKAKKEPEILTCGQETNTILPGVLDARELIGFIKDDAWSYENEYRLRVDIVNNEQFEGVSISIPDDVIDSIELVAGPRFEGDLLQRIQSEISRNFSLTRISPSIFNSKLNWVYCDSCKR